MKKPFLVRTTILAVSLVLQLGFFPLQSRGAAGDVDLSFDPGLGVNGPVNAVAVQPDGKVIIGGQFTTVKGLLRTNIARLNTDGSGDATFNASTAHSLVSSLALQSDGKMIVVGQFVETVCDEFDCYYYYDLLVARLNANGSLDSSFNPARGASDPYGVSSVALQPDGKVLVGGAFSTMNGTNSGGIARLNANGTLDPSFNSGAGMGGYQVWVSDIVVQSDGKVIIGGNFDSFDGTNRNGIARLNSNGSLDGGFNPGAELMFFEGYPYARVESLAKQSDGKLLVGGYFTNANGNSILRFNADGTLDSSFNSGTGANGIVFSLAVQSDGRVLLGGSFNAINGTVRNRIARLNANGSVDSSFNPGTGVNADVIAMVVQSDGKAVIGGAFTTVNDTNRNRVARLNVDGSLDGSFYPGRGLEYSISKIALQSDGKVLIGGVFTFVNGTNQYGSDRLNADGSFDHTFVSGTNFNPDLAALNQTDDCPAGYNCYRSTEVNALVVQPDGKVLMGGDFLTIACDPFEGFCDYIYQFFLARFNSDGSRDNSFATIGGQTYNSQTVRALAVQPDGKILFAGNGVFRLNANGTSDSSFNAGYVSSVNSILVQLGGKVLIGTSYGIVRLNSDGSRDACFNPAIESVYSLVQQPDGRILVGGSFSTVNGVNRNGVARINENGSLDTSFDPGTGADGVVRAIALQPDGNVLIGGDFITVDGVTRHYVARLFGGSSAQPRLRVFSTPNNAVTVAWPSSSAGFTLQQNTNVATPTWISVATIPSTVGAENHVSVSASAGQRFFRLFSTATNTPPPPSPPPAAPELTASFGDASVSLRWAAFSEATSHHLQRATNYNGPYTTIAYPSTTNYTDTTVVNGRTYYYIVSTIYPCGESLNSVPVGGTPYVTPTIHVQSITMSFVPHGSRFYTRAVVNVVDNTGTPYNGATVTGNFTGSISDPRRTGVTGGNGKATITSSPTIKNGTVTFTVTGVAAGIGYNPAANVVTSATISR
jgi:uncharacterized delta-60 repeat protein